MEKSLGLVQAVKICLSKYATFEGRARRSEYWWFYLATFVVGLVLGGIPILGWIICIALILPGIAVAVRRLHDIGKSGWWYLLCLIPLVGTIILIVWFVRPGVAGANQYGEDPKADASIQ